MKNDRLKVQSIKELIIRIYLYPTSCALSQFARVQNRASRLKSASNFFFCFDHSIISITKIAIHQRAFLSCKCFLLHERRHDLDDFREVV